MYTLQYGSGRRIPCSHFNDIRKRLLNCFYSRAPNSLKFKLLMNVQNEVESENLCIYVKNIMKTFN